MALTDTSLAEAIRADETTAARLRPVAEAMVSRHAPGAPEAVRDEAAIRIAGYLLDAPPSPAGPDHAAVMLHCGAAGLLSPWKVRRAGAIDAGSS